VPFKTVLDDVEVGSLDRDAEATVREELGRIHRLANVKDALVRSAGTSPDKKRASAVAVGAGFEVRVGLAGAVDVQAELARIAKEIAKLEQDLAGVLKKLDNPSFVAKAPPEVVEKDRARADELREKRGKLEAHRAMLSDTEASPAANAVRREAMENQNPQDPNQPAPPAAQPAQTSMEQVVSSAVEVGKAAVSAVMAGAEAALEKVMPAKKPAKAKKPAARKPARKAAKAARKAAPRKAAAKKTKKPARKAARKPAAKAKRGAKRGKKR
jgi:valyl-tRNA synthetase